ncbi:hypothetical protein OIV19_16585 [Brucella sp. HL-2]|nr:hypothetical protein [Brucella sp. HL-2]MCV9909221.1 hypothetical protein [Brucella sp. HL-2]
MVDNEQWSSILDSSQRVSEKETHSVVEYDYFRDHFKAEDFSIDELFVDTGHISCVVNLTAHDKIHASLLLLDRVSQSLGFSLIAYILKQQGKFARFLLIKSMSWSFTGFIRPNHPVKFEVDYTALPEGKKTVYHFIGSVNGNKARFNVTIDVFSKASVYQVGSI